MLDAVAKYGKRWDAKSRELTKLAKHRIDLIDYVEATDDMDSLIPWLLQIGDEVFPIYAKTKKGAVGKARRIVAKRPKKTIGRLYSLSAKYLVR